MSDDTLHEIERILDASYDEMLGNVGSESHRSGDDAVEEQRLMRRYRAVEMILTLYGWLDCEPIFTPTESDGFTELLMELVRRIEAAETAPDAPFDPDFCRRTREEPTTALAEIEDRREEGP